MAVHTANKGLELPITGAPEQKIEEAPAVSRVAVIADDYVGMKPKMHVKVGQEVKRGQLLFEDRKAEGVRHTAPAAGRVAEVNRGQFRALQSVVIELSDAAKAGQDAQVDLEHYAGKKIGELERDDVVALLVESGLWALLRERPFSRTPSPSDEPPKAMFITAADSNPLSAEPSKALKGREDDFKAGVEVLAKLTEGKTFVCTKAGARVDAPKGKNISVEEFEGPHPSGTVGYHIHTLFPVTRGRTVWHVGYQATASIGRLFTTGQIDHTRVVALAGPQVKNPRLLQTRAGACLSELLAGELEEGDNRMISGSVLSGRDASAEVVGYLGVHANQISVLREGRERVFLGWLTPGFDAYSTSGIYLSSLTPDKKFDFTTTTNGSKRAMVPIGMYERVFPFDIMPTFLLRALLKDDTVRAEELGILELDEEDVAVCTFVCPGKHNYANVLRRNLDIIWKEG